MDNLPVSARIRVVGDCIDCFVKVEDNVYFGFGNLSRPGISMDRERKLACTNWRAATKPCNERCIGCDESVIVHHCMPFEM